MTYKVQIDDEVRNATPFETANIESQQQAEVDRQIAAEASLATKASARAKLAALGLTESEIAALVG